MVMSPKCGDVPQFWQRYNSLETRPFSNITHKDQWECFYHVFIEANWKQGNANCDCPLPCTEMEYKANVISNGNFTTNEWFINMRAEDQRVREIIEVPDYTLEECLGATGGILGLAIGASSLSVVELVVYFVLRIVRKVY